MNPFGHRSPRLAAKMEFHSGLLRVPVLGWNTEEVLVLKVPLLHVLRWWPTAGILARKVTTRVSFIWFPWEWSDANSIIMRDELIVWPQHITTSHKTKISRTFLRNVISNEIVSESTAVCVLHSNLGKVVDLQQYIKFFPSLILNSQGPQQNLSLRANSIDMSVES